MEYKLKSGYVTIPAEASSIEEAKKEADSWSSYNSENLEILNKDHEVVAIRRWQGSLDAIEDAIDPIQFGDYGYLRDWEWII